jgi:transposase
VIRTTATSQADIEAAIDTASEAGKPVLVIDMTASSAHLLLATAAARGMPVAYVTGLQMRRAADLYAGSAKTDPRDAFILADYARRHVDRLTWLDIDDELLVRLRVLNGRDVDLAGDATRTINRCRDALVAISPALERVVGPKLTHSGVQDLMGRWATPTALRTAGKTRVRTLIAKAPLPMDSVACRLA